MLLALIVLLFIYAGYTVSTTRSHSPKTISKFTLQSTTVTVEYCRPFKKERDIFGDLVPYGEYWRTGANEPTLIEFTSDVKFSNTLVKAGKYRLYTIPNEKKWEVVLNKELERWGYYEPDYSLDVAKVDIAVSKTSDIQEQFTILLKREQSNVVLQLAWDDIYLDVPIGLMD